MKCIVKKIITVGLILCILSVTGCAKEIAFEQKYDVYQANVVYGLQEERDVQSGMFFASELCVGGNEDLLDENVTEGVSEAMGLFDLSKDSVTYAKNVHEKLYPASTTKILTAYVALKYGDLSDEVIVSEQALELEEGSSLCGLSVGDSVTLEQLLYGLMLCSGNDAANVIAELISGSVEEFAKLMNEEALALGATNSNFVNPHGLHHEEHYTTAYDLYLLFEAAMENEIFYQIMNTTAYTANFHNSAGEEITKDWRTTNQYLKGQREVPENVTVIGGKTGTTDDAGYCLVLYSEGENASPHISIVLKADSRDNLYYNMTELLQKISN